MDFENEENDNISETMSDTSVNEKPQKFANNDSDDDVDDEYNENNDSDMDENENENEEKFEEDEANVVKTVFENEEEDDEEGEEDEYDNDDEPLEKIEDLQKDIISNYHPELKTLNYEEIESLCIVVRNNKGIIIDPLHKTLPILSRYERARVLGERAEQINSGAEPFIEVDETMIDGYLIALKELEQKKIPFIIQRPLPNGGCEYWRLRDLEMI
jgi:DNA-directed RNA polymerase I, II, and III subunit RPABC2